MALGPERRDWVSASVICALSQGGVICGDDPRVCSMLVFDAAVAGDKDLARGCDGYCGQKVCEVWDLHLFQELFFPCVQLLDVHCPCGWLIGLRSIVLWRNGYIGSGPCGCQDDRDHPGGCGDFLGRVYGPVVHHPFSAKGGDVG